ncbi:MAG TPA: ribosome-associated translation inhibitor RaiA, partial [Thermoplasmata archaeon]|nr:ribosome-associated translation inhibitor RaiA [Thermoplasmata archaeon]
MDITVKGRHWKVTAEFRDYAEQRIQKLRRYFSHLANAQLTVTQEGYRHQAELRLIGNGVDLRGRAQDADPRVALDSVLAQQEQALKRRKDRLKDRKKRGTSMRR